MNGDEKSSKIIWAWIGKVAVVGTVILALLQIGQSFKGADYKISVEGEHGTFVLPPVFDKENDYLEKIINLDSLKSLLHAVKNESDRNQIAKSIHTYLLAKYNDIKNVLDELNTMCKFRIRNEGNKEITDLYLQIPSSGLYTSSQSGEKQIFSHFENKIPLGSILPENAIFVEVWTDRDIWENDTRVTHSNGSSTISYPYQTRGTSASILRNLGLIVIFLLILIMVATSIYSRFYEGIIFVRKKRKQVNGTQN